MYFSCIHKYVFWTSKVNFCGELTQSILQVSIFLIWDQPRGLVIRVSDYKSWGPEFDFRFYHGNFSLQGKIPVVTMVWVVSRFRLKAPPGISSSCISPLTSSGQRSRTSWASQTQKSATLSPQPGGKPRKFIRTCGGIGGEGGISSFDKCHLCRNLLYFSHFKSTDKVNIYCSQYFRHHHFLIHKKESKILRNEY